MICLLHSYCDILILRLIVIKFSIRISNNQELNENGQLVLLELPASLLLQGVS
jgi:hypothetical protein